MQNRYRNNQVHLDLSDDELALLNAKLRESKMKSKKLIRLSKHAF